MSKPAIRVENLGKKYRLGDMRTPNTRLAEIILDSLLRPANWLQMKAKKNKNAQESEFWALKSLSFEVEEGQIVGIIGRNGAGKSTLLKILSRITDPTEGFAEMMGRVASILEVGLGFHGELTGRENIYLNGAIQGMKRQEISRKFDDIVEFAEIGQFLDTPIKRYSSGMYVRLAFAVAANLEAEILIVDEVLAVGDMEFQKKCVGKMGDVARTGRTVLFVSHNMAAVRQLCQRTLVLSHGQVVADTSTDRGIDVYLADCVKVEDTVRQWGEPPSSAKVWPVSLQILDESDQLKSSFASHQSLSLELSIEIFQPVTCQITFTVVNSREVCIFATEATQKPVPYECGTYRLRVTLPGSLLAPDLYRLALRVHNGFMQTFFYEDHALSAVIEDASESNSRLVGMRPGVIYVSLPWTIAKMS